MLLESNNILQKLYLYNNNIGPEGAVALGRALESNNTLQELYLNNNNIGPEGAVALGRALESNITLQILVLSNNNIGNDGAVAIIGGIARNNTNTRLSELMLSFNNITRLPAELAQCPHATLTDFYYYGNPIEDNFIPPNVQRWLDRYDYQQQQNAQIYQDNQNVHNRQIQQCIKAVSYTHLTLPTIELV